MLVRFVKSRCLTVYSYICPCCNILDIQSASETLDWGFVVLECRHCHLVWEIPNVKEHEGVRISDS